MIDQAEEFYRQNFGSDDEVEERESREECEPREQTLEVTEALIKERGNGKEEKIDTEKYDEGKHKEYKEVRETRTARSRQK